MKIMTTVRDLRNWIDLATDNWMEREDGDLDRMTAAIQADDHPAWGEDWSEYLSSLNFDDICQKAWDEAFVGSNNTNG